MLGKGKSKGECRMKCYKCGKEMDRADGGTILQGIVVTIDVKEEVRTKANIAYYNKQLGKYSNGQGECKVSVCYECYIDGLFNISNSEAKENG